MRTLGKHLFLTVAVPWSVLLSCGTVAAQSGSRESDGHATANRAATSSEFVLVASANDGPITAYSALASGPVSAAFTIENPHLANTYWAPWGVASDAQGNLYVQTFLSNAT